MGKAVTVFTHAWAVAIFTLLSTFPLGAMAQCQKPMQGQRYCYCASVASGYNHCDCGRYGFCEDCTTSGSCPAGGSGGGGDIDYQDWWWAPCP